jgi:aryl-alcohol dehydrogenase-like predicted oxidoreductase
VRRGFETLKKSGKVGSVGISINDHQPDSALEIIETGLIDTVQVIYNIFDQSPESQLLPLAQKKSIGVLARVPLDEGSLTGTITEKTEFESGDFRNFYFSGDRKKQVVEHVQQLEKDLGAKEGPLPEVALRFCLSHPAVSTVIPGMRSRRHVQSNCGVSDQGPLSDKTRAMLKKHAWQRNFYA